MAHPNEDLIRKGYQAFAAQDMATLNELFADDVVWHAQGRNQLPRPAKVARHRHHVAVVRRDQPARQGVLAVAHERAHAVPAFQKGAQHVTAHEPATAGQEYLVGARAACCQHVQPAAMALMLSFREVNVAMTAVGS